MASSFVLSLSAGHSLLHISWLMVVLSRVFVHHEAKTIVRWGVQETLNMNLEGSPLLQEEHWEVYTLCKCIGWGIIPIGLKLFIDA